MLRNKGFLAVLVASAVGLTACVPPPPRHTVVYRESDQPTSRVYHESDQPPSRVYHESDQPPSSVYHESDRVYRESDQSPSSRYCHDCGTVRDVARVEIRQGTSGGGAVLGAIIGGLVGNQFGGGSGKAAMTAAGVVGGAVVGNEIEESNAHAGSGNAWRFRVELDDGRMATVTQYENPGFHPGNRVAIQGDHIVTLR